MTLQQTTNGRVRMCERCGEAPATSTDLATALCAECDAEVERIADEIEEGMIP